MIENWRDKAERIFLDYVDKYKDVDEKQRKKIERKRDHILRVAKNSQLLSERMNLDKTDEDIAFAVALFHDLGRFEQYTTTNETKEEHGAVAVQLLKSNEILDKLGFDDTARNIIYRAIENHGLREINKHLDDKERFHAQLIRDADKLDIFKVVTEKYSNHNTDELSWDLPKGGVISENVKNAILNNKLVNKEDVENETDAKILQLSWIYDINFKTTIEMILDKRYIEMIYNTLSKNDTVIEIHRKIKVYAENKIYSNK